MTETIEFQRLERTCDLLREYAAAKIGEYEGGPVVYEADWPTQFTQGPVATDWVEQHRRAEVAEAKLARIEALLDSAENAPGRSFMRMHDGSPFPVLINALELRAILRGDQ